MYNFVVESTIFFGSVPYLENVIVQKNYVVVLTTIFNNVTIVLFAPTNSILVLTTVIDVEFTDIVNKSYVCDWYQKNHILIISMTFNVGN